MQVIGTFRARRVAVGVVVALVVVKFKAVEERAKGKDLGEGDAAAAGLS